MPAVREIVSVALIFALADHKSVLVGRLPEELFFRFELGVGVGSDKHYDRVGSCWLDSRARLVVRGGSFQRPLKLQANNNQHKYNKSNGLTCLMF